MHQFNKKWTVFLIHHTHTDIGYTNRQEKIQADHIDYIRQVINTFQEIKRGNSPYQGFKWNCEVFWAVEKFWENASEEEKVQFLSAIKNGDIEISANYLNMTELAGDKLYKRMLQRAVAFGKSYNFSMKSFMTADVNGLSWGWSQALSNAGIENIYSCVHTHHGMFPCYEKQRPFFWETPQGNKLLVWNGEHYQFGNELGLMPNAVMSYTIRENISFDVAKEREVGIAPNRLIPYLKMLEEEGYPYDFVPVTVHGLPTDNAPPNPELMHFVRQWNEKYSDQVELKVTTLTPFFDHLRQHPNKIPTYKGDWPDWWSDGIASTAGYTALFREAQRNWELACTLNDGQQQAVHQQLEDAAYNLMLYAEHTWGYYLSVANPYSSLTQRIEARKMSYAAKASEYANGALDKILDGMGQEKISAVKNKDLRYTIVNPWEYLVETMIALPVKQWELIGQLEAFEIIEEATDESYIYQYERMDTGCVLYIEMRLKPGEEKTLMVRSVNQKVYSCKIPHSDTLVGADTVEDIKPLDHQQNHCEDHNRTYNSVKVTERYIETDFVKLIWTSEQGIISWYDKCNHQELINPQSIYGAFTPVYEVTPAVNSDDVTRIRIAMGRNRKGINVRRYSGKLEFAQIEQNGPLYTCVTLHYQVEGIEAYRVHLTVYKNHPRIDVTVKLHKKSIYWPESVYIALPFSLGKSKENKLMIDKGGVWLEPWKDQLPGSLTDYYCVQNGIAMTSKESGLVIGLQDTPLIQLGSLQYGDRLLQGHPELSQSIPEVFSWVLNNIWETNFKADCGGFYEFKYSVEWGGKLREQSVAQKKCISMNKGAVCYRSISEKGCNDAQMSE